MMRAVQTASHTRSAPVGSGQCSAKLLELSGGAVKREPAGVWEAGEVSARLPLDLGGEAGRDEPDDAGDAVKARRSLLRTAAGGL